VPQLHELSALCPFATRCEVVLPACAGQAPVATDLGGGHHAHCLRLQATQQVAGS